MSTATSISVSAACAHRVQRRRSGPPGNLPLQPRGDGRGGPTPPLRALRCMGVPASAMSHGTPSAGGPPGRTMGDRAGHDIFVPGRRSSTRRCSHSTAGRDFSPHRLSGAVRRGGVGRFLVHCRHLFGDRLPTNTAGQVRMPGAPAYIHTYLFTCACVFAQRIQYMDAPSPLPCAASPCLLTRRAAPHAAPPAR